jgi:hypothetical protein
MLRQCCRTIDCSLLAKCGSAATHVARAGECAASAGSGSAAAKRRLREVSETGHSTITNKQQQHKTKRNNDIHDWR